MKRKSMGSFLSELRREKGITQRELAEILNVSDKTVSHWECDENSPDLSIIPIIADYFGVTCDELLKGERRAENTVLDSSHSSHIIQTSDNLTKNQNMSIISKGYTKHKIICISSVFISFFSLMLLVGIILLAEHITGLDFLATAVFVALAFAAALCLLITFISSQSFNSIINTAEIPADEKRKLKTKGRLNCLFPLIYVAVILFIVFKVLMPVTPSNNENPTMTVPSSVKPDTSYSDISVEIYAATSEFIY